jgi:hypothetical protein
MPITLNPSFTVVDQILDRVLTVDEINAEPSLLSTNPVMAMMLGGPITRDFLTRCMATAGAQAAVASGLHPVLDVRTQYLKPGAFPSVPGWHCDLVPIGAHAQPDFSRIDPLAVHFLMLLSTESDGVSLTEYLPEPFTFEPDPEHVWDSLQAAILTENPPVSKIETGKIYRFDSYAAHNTSPVTTQGWRIFLRLSLQKSPAIGNRIVPRESNR